MIVAFVYLNVAVTIRRWNIQAIYNLARLLFELTFIYICHRLSHYLLLLNVAQVAECDRKLQTFWFIDIILIMSFCTVFASRLLDLRD